MKKYADNQTYKIYQGSMLDLLEVIEQNTIDSVVTDPPYELNFMNKGWDRSGIAFQKDTWDKCYEALKPGGYLLAFGGSRTFHRIAVAIEDAGFEIRDVIMWVYGSGFPKSHNVGLSIDKMLGEANRGHRVATASRNHPDGTFEPNGDDLPPYEAKQEQAKQWQGWGTALKPAYEPIIVARKPLKGTVAQNVMQYGVGAINIDECRVEYENTSNPATNPKFRKDENYKINHGIDNNSSAFKLKKEAGEMNINNIGRFPANFIHDGSDEVTLKFPSTEAGGSLTKEYQDNAPLYGDYGMKPTFDSYGDSGNASRFFYTAKASKKDRDEGLTIKPRFTASAEFRPNHMEKALDGESGNPYGRWQPRKNIHPTVKPCELMQYLVRLVTPKNGTVLDPFMGSGSTGKATMFENRERKANYKFVGIDLDLDNQYCEIANARIDYALNKFEYDEQEIREQDKAKGQMSIFDLM